MNNTDYRRDALTLAIEHLRGNGNSSQIIKLANNFLDFILDRKVVVRANDDVKTFFESLELNSLHFGKTSFKLWKHQEKCLDAYIANDVTVVTQARQMGMTTLSAAYALWYATTHNAKVVISTPTMTQGDNMMSVIFGMLSSMPSDTNGGYVASSKSLAFDNGGRITAIPAPHSMHGISADLLIVDQCAYISHSMADSFLRSLQSAIIPNAKVVITSSVGCEAGLFHRLTEKDSWGSRKMEHIVLPFSEHDLYSEERAQETLAMLGQTAYDRDMCCILPPPKLV